MTNLAIIDELKFKGMPIGDEAQFIARLIVSIGKRGRTRSLFSAPESLRRQKPAAGSGSDHPWLNPGRLYQDTLAFAEGSDCVARNFQGLMSVPRHVAGLQGRIVHYVTIACGPFFEKVDRILKRRYFPDQVSAFLQINGPVEQLQGHCYLTENVGDQQGGRCASAPGEDLFSRFLSFKGVLMRLPKNSWVVAG